MQAQTCVSLCRKRSARIRVCSLSEHLPCVHHEPRLRGKLTARAAQYVQSSGSATRLDLKVAGTDLREGRHTPRVPLVWASVLSPERYADAETIIPAPTVSFVASSIRMNAPVVRLSP